MSGTTNMKYAKLKTHHWSRSSRERTELAITVYTKHSLKHSHVKLQRLKAVHFISLQEV